MATRVMTRQDKGHCAQDIKSSLCPKLIPFHHQPCFYSIHQDKHNLPCFEQFEVLSRQDEVLHRRSPLCLRSSCCTNDNQATRHLRRLQPSSDIHRYHHRPIPPNLTTLINPTDATCSLSKSLTPGEPFSNAYPTALALGTIVTPLLDAALGKQVVEDIDTVADDLCINAEESDGEGNGICQDALQAIDDFVLAVDPTGQAAKYQCLLNLLCVAHAGVPYNSLCTYLLAGQDCIANRIIGVSNLECES